MPSFDTSVLFSSAGSLTGSILNLFMLAIMTGVVTTALFFVLTVIKYNHECIIYSRTKSGYQIKKQKGGFIKTKKGQYEFRTFNPKHRINQFERDWIIMGAKRKWKPQVYLWQRNDNKLEQMNPKFFEDISKGTILAFEPRQLGKGDFSEEFDKLTKEMWTINDFFGKYGNAVITGGFVVTLIILNLFTLSKLGG